MLLDFFCGLIVLSSGMRRKGKRVSEAMMDGGGMTRLPSASSSQILH